MALLSVFAATVIDAASELAEAPAFSDPTAASMRAADAAEVRARDAALPGIDEAAVVDVNQKSSSDQAATGTADNFGAAAEELAGAEEV